jgi:hypothetical protein
VYVNSNWQFSLLSVRDCSFHGGLFYVRITDDIEASFHNNLFARTRFSIAAFGLGGVAPEFRNNLFRGGIFDFDVERTPGSI